MPKNAIDVAAERARVFELAKQKNLRIVLNRENHIKIGDVNFHPTTGTFYRDGQRSPLEKGADAFISYVEGINLTNVVNIKVFHQK